MAGSKSTKNKTINTSVAEGGEFLSRCVKAPSKMLKLSEVINKTILGSMNKVCPLLPPKSVDLIIADPPYNLTKLYGSTKFSKKNSDEYESYTYEWLRAIKPLLKENGSIYVCCDWQSSLIVGRAVGELFFIKNRITWQREKGRGAKNNWKNSMEDIWFATNGKSYTFNLDSVKIRKKVIAPYRINGKPKDWVESKNGCYRDTCPSNFWGDITVPFWSMSENTSHPTQKPEKLIAKIILASSNENDIILDPFFGSGTTGAAAAKLNRRFIGIETEPQYCIWAEQRIKNAKINPTIQGYKNGVFYERNF